MSKSDCFQKEPLAIVGIGCRFPGGASNPEKFWELLINKKDVMVDIPEKRWDWRQFCDSNKNKLGKAYNFQGGFLEEDIELFDPLFFGISPREARLMDAQQRLLLEVAYEAMEDAGITKEKLFGSNTGVFVGGFWLDHQINQFGSLNIDTSNTHSPMSATQTLLSNRLSYVFNLHGPSLTIDTACSSSLVALHYGCNSIWNNESDSILVGGVNIMTSPSNSIGLSKGQFLSDHSRCMTFDERASGYARGEGAAIVYIIPLSKAMDEKLPIYSVIRGTGVNQDGQTPGITMPNSDAQKVLLKKVYKDAGVSPKEIQYIEAHGTGTQAGDKAESEALNEVLSADGQRDKPLIVGSVKTNMGHLEAASGMAGLIKASLSLKNKKIPANLHFEKPNPEIPFDEMCLQVPTELIKWPQAKKYYAGVNSFGYGGTNAHVLLEAAPEKKQNKEKLQEGMVKLIPVSAQSESGLQEVSRQLELFVDEKKCNLNDLISTLCINRSHHNIRSFVIAKNANELKEQLKAIHQGTGPELRQIENNKKLVMVFTGMGPQWWAMGRCLYETNRIFKFKVDECDDLFKKISTWSIKEEMLAVEEKSRMAETAIAQPANFVIQAALFELLTHWGIKPDAIIGHSVGEVAAAYTSGALTLEEALLVSYHRSRLQQTLAGKDGGMLAINYSEQDSLALFEELGVDLSIAAVNSSVSVTVSGDLKDIKKLSDYLEEQGQFNRQLKVEVAYHSKQMEPIKDELDQVLSVIKPRSTTIPLYSTVTGNLIEGQKLDADYWWKNVRQPVYFQKGMCALIKDEMNYYLEVGPHPVLAQSIQTELMNQNKEGQLFATLNRKQDEAETFYAALGNLYQAGVDLDWSNQMDGSERFVKLPSYPWQREQFWYESKALMDYRFGQKGHPLLNHHINLPEPTWEVEMNDHFLPFLKDHRIGAHVVVPGAMYVETGFAIYEKMNESFPMTLEKVNFRKVLNIQEDKVQKLHTRYNPQNKQVDLYSTSNDEDAIWNHHAFMFMKNTPSQTIVEDTLETIQRRCEEELDVEGFYDQLAKRDLNYGPYFTPITQIKRGHKEVVIKLEPSILPEEKEGYLFGPTILDALFQSLIVVDKTNSNDKGNKTYIPVQIDEIVLFERPQMPCYGWTSLQWKNDKKLKGNAVLFDATGKIVAEVKGVTCQHLAQAQNDKEAFSDQWVYELIWKPEKRKVPVISDRQEWLLVDLGSELIAGFEKKCGHETATLSISSLDASGKDGKHKMVEWENWEAGDQIIFFADQVGSQTDDGLYDTVIESCQTIIEWLQCCLESGNGPEMNITLVSQGLHHSKNAQLKSDIASAPLWGLIRVVRNEYPQVNWRLIDIERDMEAEHACHELIQELLVPVGNEEVALTGEARYVHSLNNKQIGDQEEKEVVEMISTESAVILNDESNLKLSHFYFTEFERKEPGPDEVEIKVSAVMLEKVKGQAVPTTGAEFEGEIAAVGKDVKHLESGQKVKALCPCSFASFVCVPAKYVHDITGKEHADDQTLTMPMVVAAYTLLECAGLKKGETVLINKNADKVGLAMKEVANSLGAEVIVLVGDDSENSFWKDSMGVRIVDKEQEQLSDVVDVLVNFGDIEHEDEAVRSMKSFGRVVRIVEEEMISSGISVSLAKKHCSLQLLNMEWLFEEHALKVNDIISKLKEVIKKQNITLPSERYLISNLESAMQVMEDQQNKKNVVVTFEDQVPVVKYNQNTLVNDKGTYLITGGTGGFGLEVAKWLSEQNAGHIVLVSRSGDKRPETKKAVQALRNQDQDVTVLAVDITSAEDVHKMIETIEKQCPPLKGIIHSAMVLEDSYLKDISAEQFEKVMAPKMKGILHIDSATSHMDLDFFVMFSSISSLIGNMGQASYCAANAWLDAFAHYRKKNGKPATTINWGVLAESGVVARNKDVADLLEHAGLKGFDNNQALNALEKAIALNTAQLGLFDVDWPVWLSQNQQQAKCSMFKELAKSKAVKNEQLEALLEQLRSMDKEDRVNYIESKITEVISRVVKIPKENIRRTENIMNYGVDSLMALDLARSLKKELELELSMIELMNGPSVNKLGDKLLQQMDALLCEQIEEDIEDMSEDELDALLAQELSE